jgi:hypothetical protein
LKYFIPNLLSFSTLRYLGFYLYLRSVWITKSSAYQNKNINKNIVILYYNHNGSGIQRKLISYASRHAQKILHFFVNIPRILNWLVSWLFRGFAGPIGLLAQILATQYPISNQYRKLLGYRLSSNVVMHGFSNPKWTTPLLYLSWYTLPRMINVSKKNCKLEKCFEIIQKMLQEQ